MLVHPAHGLECELSELGWIPFAHCHREQEAIDMVFNDFSHSQGQERTSTLNCHVVLNGTNGRAEHN